MTMMMIIIKIIFSRTHALPPWIITSDLTIHKHKSITKKNSNWLLFTNVYVASIHLRSGLSYSSKQIFMTASLIYTTNWMLKKLYVNEYWKWIYLVFTTFSILDLHLTDSFVWYRYYFHNGTVKCWSKKFKFLI